MHSKEALGIGTKNETSTPMLCCTADNVVPNLLQLKNVLAIRAEVVLWDGLPHRSLLEEGGRQHSIFLEAECGCRAMGCPGSTSFSPWLTSLMEMPPWLICCHRTLQSRRYSFFGRLPRAGKLLAPRGPLERALSSRRNT